MKLKSRITIFLLLLAFAGAIVLDFWLDGCIAPPMSTGNALCGEEARSEVIVVVTSIFVAAAVVLFFFDKDLLPNKKSSGEEQK